MSWTPGMRPGDRPGAAGAPEGRQRGPSRVREQRVRRGGLFVPLVFAFAAQLEGLPVAEFVGSPTKLTNGLRSVFGRFGVDGVVCWCDDTAVAASLGCELDWSTYPPGVAPLAPPPDVAAAIEAGSPKVPRSGPAAAAVEVVRRIGSLQPDTVLVASIPGPATLAAQLGGPASACEAGLAGVVRAAAKVCLAQAKALGDAGLDVLLVREGSVPSPQGPAPGVGDVDVAGADAASAGPVLTPADVTRLYSPIWNTARHYGMAALLALDRWDEESAGLLAGAVDGVVVPPPDVAAARGRFRRVGMSVPADLLGAEPADLERFLARHDVAGRVAEGVFLVTTDREVSVDVGREALLAGIATVRDLTKGGMARG